MAYTNTEVSLQNKSQYFTETYHKALGHDPSSNGKVPILIDGDKIITESDVIAWYVAEKYQTGTQLIPEDAYDRARLRIFVSEQMKIGQAFVSLIGLSKKTEEEKKQALEKVKTAVADLESKLTLPYALGNQFTLADVLVYPWYERLPVFLKIVSNDGLDEFKKVREWINNVQSRDAVKKVLETDEYYKERFQNYL